MEFRKVTLSWILLVSCILCLEVIAPVVLNAGGSVDPELRRERLPYEAEQQTRRVSETKDPSEVRIAIIGAGAAGLTAAHFLKQKGYEHITVYEANDRVGGKVKSIHVDGQKYESGAQWIINTKENLIVDLTKYYGITPVLDTVSFKFQARDGTTYNGIIEYITSQYSVWEFACALSNTRRVYNKFAADVEKIGFDQVPLDSDLMLNFEVFVAKYEIGAAADFFSLIFTGNGYGWYFDSPTVYVAKLFFPFLDVMVQLLKTTVKGALTCNSSPFGSLSQIPGGYQSLWEAVAADFSDVRLNHAVTKVARHKQDGGSYLIEVTSSQGETNDYDYMIITCDMSIAKQFLGDDLSSTEANLFSKIFDYTLIYTLGETRNVVYEPQDYVVFATTTDPENVGGLIAAINRPKNPTIWELGQTVPGGESWQQVYPRLTADVTDLMGGILTEVRHRDVWEHYFPRVSPDNLRNGFYRDMRKLQGEKGTFYAGALMNFETVDNTATFSKDLVRRYF